MSNVQEQIRNAASQNASLLSTLSRTDYAPPALQQQNKYIQELENEVAHNDGRLRQLTTSREKEMNDHRKYHDSVMKRFAYKATGQKEKFSTRAEKEEKEYFEALRAEHAAKSQGEDLAKQLQEAKQSRSQLEPVASEHDRAQKELDALYNSIFAGPTPSYAEEDTQEQAVNAELNEYRRIESMVRAEEQVKQLLGQAARAMVQAQDNLQDALHASRMDMMGGGAFSDMMERSALGKAEGCASQAQRFVEQASGLSPHVQRLGQINIAQGNLMSDVFFDNIFTDMAFHDKIKDSAANLQQAGSHLQHIQRDTDQRLQDLRSQMSAVLQRLNDGRQKLQNVREQIFQTVAGNQNY